MTISVAADPYGGNCAVSSSGDSSHPMVTPNLPALTEFTAMFWFRAESLHTDFHYALKLFTTVLNFGSETGYYVQLVLTQNTVGPDYHFNVYHYAGPGELPDSNLHLDTWIHVALTGNSSGYKLHVNGAWVADIAEEFVRLQEEPALILHVYDPQDKWFDLQILSQALPPEVISWYYADRLTNGANTLPPGA